MHPLHIPLPLVDALALFQQWLATPAHADGQRDTHAALCLASRLQRGGYAIRRKDEHTPWALVQAGVALALECPPTRRLLWTWEGSAKALGALVAERRAAAAGRGLLSREATDAA